MLFVLSPSVIFDTIRAHAALQTLGRSGQPFNIFLSPDHAGLTNILIKNSFARLVGSLPTSLVVSSSIDGETPQSAPAEEVNASCPEPRLTLELALQSAGNAVATRRSLERA
ncbi:MAG: hypothetical protein K2K55_07635, partial [Duncaniella sp.]|nr:hypothetical protein [Duncaniella sp.]